MTPWFLVRGTSALDSIEAEMIERYSMFRVAFLTFIMGVMAVLAQGCNDTDLASRGALFVSDPPLLEPTTT